MKVYAKVRSLMVSKKGQGLVEYGLILAGVALVAVAVFTIFASDTGIKGAFDDLITNVSGRIGTAATR